MNRNNHRITIVIAAVATCCLVGLPCSNPATASTCPVSVVGWGSDYNGETDVPTNLSEVVAISGGSYYSLALKGDGTVVGWGANSSGQATPPTNLTGVVAIAAGSDHHSLALKSDGTVVGWGYDYYGETTPPFGVTGVVAIAAGSYHSLALKGDGTVIGWGYYDYATPPGGVTGVVAIAAGSYHSLALKSDGTVVGWGYDYFGQATPPAGLTNAVAVAAGTYHSLALKSNGTVVGWGYDYAGQASPPTNLTGVVAIAAGAYSSLALKSDGSVVAWGDDGSGQVSGADGMTGASAIAAGGFHSLALTTAPRPPSDLMAIIVATNRVSLSWSDNSTNEVGFDIERALDDGGVPGTWTRIGQRRANGTNFVDATITPDTTYWYRVRSFSDACGKSPYCRTFVSLVLPAAPYSLGATLVATNEVQVDLYWYPGSGNEAGYKLERAPDDNGNPGTWAEIAMVVGGTNTFYTDTGVMANATYWYRVRGYNIFGDSDYSDLVVVSVGPPDPPYLGGATLVATNQIQINVQWYGNGVASGYKLERAPDASGNPGAWTQIADLSGNGNTFYTDTSVMPNVTYWYRVRAYNLIGDSDYSNFATVGVVPPPNIVYLYPYAASADQPKVDLYWYDYYNYSLSVAGYKIERAPDVSGNPGPWTEIAAVTNGYTYSNFYSDAGVTGNATYWYRVRAFNAVGNAPYSFQASVSIAPPSNVPYPGAYLVATNQAEVYLYWYDYSNSSGNVTGYKIERAPDVSGNPGTWTEIATVGGYNYYSSYSDTGVIPNSTYWYRVRAYNVVGDSPSYSSPISMVIGPPLYAPYSLYGYVNATNQAQVDLYWYDYNNYSGSVAGYKIERAPDVSGNPGTWTEIATVSGYNYYSSYSDTAVIPNSTYWYRVRAYNVIGGSDYSYPTSIVVGPPLYAPYPGAYLVITNQPEIHLYWYDYSNYSGSVAGYKLERALDVSGSPGAWAEIATVARDNYYYYYSSYTDTVAPTTATYWYRVRAYNVIGDSPAYSSPISIGVAPPAAPNYLNASLPSTSREVDLFWYSNSGTEAGYKVERAPDVGGSPGTWTVVATTVGQYNTSYNDTTVETNTTYWYRVLAYNVVGDSAPSYAVSIGPPPAPSNLTAAIAATNQVDLSWFESYENVAGFKIERAPDVGGIPGTWTEIATTVGQYNTSYSDTTVETNTTYWYRVRANNVLGDSPYSNEANVTIAPPNAAPTSLTATTASASQINLSWTDNSNNESSFKIERSTDGTNFTQIAQVLANTTYYRNTGLLPGRNYYYRVRASNPVDDSAFSNVASAGTLAQCSASVVGWGADWYGQATPPAGLSNVVAIAGGYYHSLALESDGTVVGWGSSYYATPPTNLTAAVAISAGNHNSLALKSDGTVVGWGDNIYGETTPPAELSNVVAIAAGGYYHSLALKSDGTVVGLGYYYYATPPAGLVGVVAIAAGSYHSLALKSDGTVVGWGDNGYGRATPPDGLTGVVAVAAGYYHSLALRSDGTVIGWGDSYYATPPAGLSNVVAIAAGPYHSLALKSDGTIVGWGYDGYGQATPPAGLSGVAIAAGVYHSLALSTGVNAPSTLMATAILSDQVNLSWISTAVGPTGFTIERAPDDGGSPGTWMQIASVASNITAYSDMGLMAGTTYWYRVRAHTECGDSAYSSVVSAFVRNGQLVRVMQWNIEHNLGRQSNNSGSAAQALARIVNYNRPDILLFCEVDAQILSVADNQAALTDWVTNNVPYLGTNFYVAVSTQTDGFNRNAAISRYPMLTEGTYDDGLRGLHSFKVQLSATNALQVFHTHLKCCSDDCTRKHNEAQFDANTISAWAATNAIPYIFAGDWNDDEQSPLCALPNTITTIREGGGLVEFKPTTLDGEYRTWSSQNATPSIRFDYILAATNRLAPLSGYVFSSSVWQNHGLNGGFNFSDSATASDHYCVFADYFFPEGNGTPNPFSSILDDLFPYGTRAFQYLPTSTAWWASNGGSLTAAPGAMTLMVGGSSVMAITYFTRDSSSSPVWLNVGDTLTATFKFIFDGIPTDGTSSQGFRIGLLNFADSTLNPKRVSADWFSDSQGNGVQGYALFEKMYGSFSDNQPMDLRKRTFLSDASLLGTSADWTSIVKNHLNTSAFPGFANLTPYSLQFVLQRSSLDSLIITVTWSNMLNGATLSESVADTSASNFAFDGIAIRPQNSSQAPAAIQFKEVRVEVKSVPVAPSIVTQPQDQSVSSGQNATFAVVPNGTLPLFYQWFYNTGTPLANATNSALTIVNAQSPNAGGYSVIVSNAYGSVTSVVAQLTVTVTPPSIITQPQDLTLIPGQSATFSVVAIGNAPLSYQWYFNTSTPLPGATATTLILPSVQASDAGSYSVLVSNNLGSVISSNALLSVNTNPVAPLFIMQPASLTVVAGANVNFTAAAVGTQPITYQWKKNGNAIANATNATYAIANSQPTDSGTYSIVASNPLGSVTSSNAILTVLKRAFAGAEGFGAISSGGRSGAVYHVTNLNDSGSGSFRDAVSQSNRTIVFDVSGTINLGSDLSITSPNLTIAGQTAPGDGITLKGRLTEVKNTHDIIVRYIRCRPGDVNCPSFQDDAFHVLNGSNIVVDHVSSSWSIDEALSVTWSTNVTVQWCTLTESLRNSCHEKGAHGYGSLIRYGGGGISYHHNLYAHNTSRNPRGPSDKIRLDFVNNVIYNWAFFAGYNEDDSADNPDGYTNFANYVNNYLIAGSDTTQNPPRVFRSGVPNAAFTQIYQSGNLMDTNRNGALDGGDLGWSGFGGPFTTNITRLPFPLVITDSANAAYVRVLSSVGASFARDAVDSRIVSNVLQQNGAIIDSQNDVGGWPALNSLPAPTDTDQDGMPNFWEAVLGLNANNAADRNALTPDGYTRLEEYLDWLAGPHGRVQTNSFVNIELQRYTVSMQSPVYGVSNPSNGVVTLLGDGHTAQFTPTPGFSGLASFLFTATNSSVSLTGTVSVLVTPANLVWRGDGTANNWNVTTANWVDGTNVVKFSPGDKVTFNDTGSNSPFINLVGTLLPSSVTVTAAQNYTFGGNGSLGGVMSLVKSGTGRLVVTTSNTFSGGTTVSNGTLMVNNTVGSGTGIGAVTVVSGATLGGSGIIGGPVTVNGTLAPGNSAGTLTINSNLVVNAGAVLEYELGTNSDLTVVAGNLTLGGTLNVNNAGGFGPGAYTLFTYGGTLTYNEVMIGTSPSGYSYVIATNTPGQVRLSVAITPSTIGIGAADLQDRFGTVIATSSVAVLVADTGNNGFVDLQAQFPLSLGASWGSDDKVVGVWDLRDSVNCSGLDAGALCGETIVSYTGGITQGQRLRLYWFPSLTLSSNTLGITYYGEYTDTNSPPLDGGDAWVVPVGGSSAQLLFITASEGGTNPDAAGRATLLTAVPLTAFEYWQIQYFGSTNNQFAALGADPDGDGIDNNAEFLTGTNPTNSASAFRITAIAREGDDIRVTWTTGTGKTNTLQAAGDDFTDLFTVTNTVGPITNYLDVGAVTNAPARFYRVRLVP
jgi:autotransporter-associated beta strand protein